MITDSEELTEAMTEAGELEDSITIDITDKMARVLRFIELQTLGKTPPPSPVSHASLISRPTVAGTELPPIVKFSVYYLWFSARVSEYGYIVVAGIIDDNNGVLISGTAVTVPTVRIELTIEDIVSILADAEL